MQSALRWAKGLTRKAPLVPLHLPTSDFTVVADSVPLEEENLDEFKTGQYGPITISTFTDCRRIEAMDTLP